MVYVSDQFLDLVTVRCSLLFSRPNLVPPKFCSLKQSVHCPKNLGYSYFRKLVTFFHLNKFIIFMWYEL